MAKAKQDGIFISHAAADDNLIQPFMDLLIAGLGISQKKIFCSSQEGMGIPRGENFIAYIKKQLSTANFVIAIITPRYYESVFCLCELGATWMTEQNFFPILVPPLGYKDLKGILIEDQAGIMNDPKTLDELRDRLLAVKLGDAGTYHWSKRRDVFIDRFANAEIKKAANIPAAMYQELKDKYKEVQKMLAERDSEIDKLKDKIESLEECKDEDEVAAVRRATGTTEEEFDELIEAFKIASEKLPNAVIEALFYKCSGSDWRPETGFGTDEIWNPITDAEERGYLSIDDGEVTIQDHPRIRKAVKCLDNIDDFLRTKKGSEYAEALEVTEDYPIKLSNREFWENYLGLY